MICTMCLFHNPADAESCIHCKRMRFTKRPTIAPPAEDKDVRLDRPNRETIDQGDTCVDWSSAGVADPA